MAISTSPAPAGTVDRLEIANLIAEAELMTGLSDWGDDDFREPLRILVEAIEQEAGINPRGREKLLHWFRIRLAARLMMVEDRKRRPEIAAQVIAAPLFQMGLPRAGTTFLHTLLGLDPAHRSYQFWQMFFPSPPVNDPAFDTAERVAAMADFMDLQGWREPDLRALHFHDPDTPEEDFFTFENSFISTGFLGYVDIPGYAAKVLAKGFAPAYRWHKYALQSAQVGLPGERWTLKAPEHTLHLAELTAEYPDALFVLQHRDPSKVAASVLSVMSRNRAGYTDRDTAIREPEARAFMQMYAAGLTKALGARHDPAMNARFVDIHYLELERDPIGCVRQVYDHIGEPFTPALEAGVRQWIAGNRKGKHGKHRYRLADYGLTQAEVHEMFAEYIDRFDVELEDDA